MKFIFLFAAIAALPVQLSPLAAEALGVAKSSTPKLGKILKSKSNSGSEISDIFPTSSWIPGTISDIGSIDLSLSPSTSVVAKEISEIDSSSVKSSVSSDSLDNYVLVGSDPREEMNPLALPFKKSSLTPDRNLFPNLATMKAAILPDSGPTLTRSGLTADQVHELKTMEFTDDQIKKVYPNKFKEIYKKYYGIPKSIKKFEAWFSKNPVQLNSK